jgi:TIGR00255 family protein
MGDTLRHLEGAIRERLQAAVARGKVEIWIFVENMGEGNAQRLDANALTAWLDKFAAADPQANLGAPGWSDLLALPGVLVREYNSEDALDAAVLRLFDAALTDFIAMRAREGEAIAGVLAARLDSMSAVLDGVVAGLPQLQEKTAAIMQERLRALQFEADPAIAGQALSQILSKMDVQEELDRLCFHIEEARKTLRQHGAIGRRLDFLMQEFNREANTLGSKAGDNAQSQASVELKVLIEQMREQVQNLV